MVHITDQFVACLCFSLTGWPGELAKSPSQPAEVTGWLAGQIFYLTSSATRGHCGYIVNVI